VVLEEAEVVAAARGQQVRPAHRPQLVAGQQVRLLGTDGALVGMGVWRGGAIAPEKMFVAAPGATGPGPGGATRTGPPPALVVEPRLRHAAAQDRVRVLAGIDQLSADLGRLYLAVGVFDGLHRGHLHLLRELRRAAERVGARPAVITFDAHPDEVIRGSAPALLCDPGERLVRLAAAGVEVTVVQHFDAALRATRYEEFVARIRERVDLAGFAMTADSAFGYERQGTPEALAAIGQQEGFGVTVVSSFLVDGEPVRSSQIRGLVEAGDLAGAQRLLGRWLSVAGRLGGNASEAQTPGGVEFDLPFALPPTGRYPVLVGPAWGPGMPAVPADRAAGAVIDGSNLALEALSATAGGERIRIVFAGGRV
jgi:riboflavin kinase/FMN adenylyltransferase